ncbi:MAG: hypothetical protein E6R03_18045 [Hyphomicrobiaceae bacterium]|nr:MAG: hypothetical protein E6R03_18045 [Hyphomicrobiaceae bacterium]
MPTTTMTFEQAYELAPQQKYFDGNPPEIGWWMTKSGMNTLHGMRWWNGEYWGIYFEPGDREVIASALNNLAENKAAFASNQIQYCARFWEGN